MKIHINAPVTKEKVEQAIELMIGKKKNTKGLALHFGKLKRKIDGVLFQKQVRNEWL